MPIFGTRRQVVFSKALLLCGVLYCRDNLGIDTVSFALAPVTDPLSCLAKLSRAMPAPWSSKHTASVRVPDIVIKHKQRNNGKIEKHLLLGKLSSLRCHSCCNKRTRWNAHSCFATSLNCWIHFWFY